MASIIQPDDRRHLGARLSVMQYLHRRRLCAAGDRVLGVPGGAAPEIQRDGGQQPHAPPAAASAARRALRPSRRRAGRQPEHVQHRGGARTNGQSRYHAASPVGSDRRARSAAARNDESPPGRAQVPPDGVDRERHVRTGGRSAGAPVGAARRVLAASADAEVPVRRHGGAPVRLCCRGERGAARQARVRRARSGRQGRAGRRRAGV